jgi:hypothetical protein
MRKLIVLLAILGLMLMAQTASAALTEELVNGDFTSGLNNWTQGVGHANFVNYGNYFNNGSIYVGAVNHTELEAQIYQVIDESLNQSWLPNGTGKLYDFGYTVAVNGLALGEVYVFYYPTNPGTQPTFNSADTAVTDGWVKLYDKDHSVFTNPSGEYSTGEVLLNGFQPRWVAVAFESIVAGNSTSDYALWTNASFEAQCVPVPPAVWLFGSGLVGLIGLRRKFSK